MTIWRSTLLLVLLGSAALPGRGDLTEHPEVAGALASIDAWIEGTRHYDRIPGLSVGIVHGDTLLWQKGYGLANVEADVPAGADTLYSICSISKLFTAIGVLQLRDAGKLSLRDPVAQHLGWFNIGIDHPKGGPVRVGSLLTHASGLPRESDFPYWTGDFPFPTRDQIIARLGEQRTLYAADTLFQYSNLALTLAGEVVQAASGTPYADYVQQRILAPIGLTDTRTYFPEDLHGQQLAIGYTGLQRDLERTPVAPFFTRGITAAAGFTSSVNDLAKFASWQFALLDGNAEASAVLDPNTLREMQRVQWMDPDWKTSWGLGFSIQRSDDRTVVGHGGGCPGYITSFSMIPEDRLGVIVLTNAGDGPAGNIGRNLRQLIAPAVAAATKAADKPATDNADNRTDAEADADARSDAPELSRYVGNYEMRPWGGEVAVRVWGDQLVAIDLPSRDLKKASVKLRHVSGHTFERLSDDDEPREPWVFELDEDGRASAFVSHSSRRVRID